MYILWIMLLFLSLYIARIVRGPSVWDRLLGLGLASSKMIMLVIVYASMNKTAYLLDFAVVYAIFGFIGVIFMAFFLLEQAKWGGR